MNPLGLENKIKKKSDLGYVKLGGAMVRIRAKGVVTNYREGGSYKTGVEGRQMKFCPYKKGGRKCFSHAKGGGGGAPNVLR